MSLADLVEVQPEWAQRSQARVAALRWEVSVERRRGRFFSAIEAFEGERSLGRDDDQARTCDTLLDQAATYVAGMVRSDEPRPVVESANERVPTPVTEPAVTTATATVVVPTPTVTSEVAAPTNGVTPHAEPPRVEPPRVEPTTERVEPPRQTPEPPPWAVVAGGHAAFSLLPVIAPGVIVGVTWRHGAISLGGELRGVIGSEVETQGSQLSTALWAAGATACVHRWWAGACAVASVGALVAERMPAGTTDAVPWVGVGARLMLDVPLRPWLRLRVRSELIANVVRAVADVEGGRRLWSQEALGHTHGAEIVVSW